MPNLIINGFPVSTLRGVQVIALEGAFIQLVDAVGAISNVPLKRGRQSLDDYQCLAALFDVDVMSVVVVVSRDGVSKVLPNELQFLTSADQNFVPSGEYLRRREMDQFARQIVQQQDRQRQRRAANQQRKKTVQTGRQPRPAKVPVKAIEASKPVDPPKGGDE